ncbi:IclR family transcriptional regulator C-terminal domain-containing protein [Streptomyces sp. NBRC 110028]|uniref:IclR family transcriptional regulator domain-containing protein n=1 Tax=Streptomyces sp. NBRC 110028 TaxID=1621260 RepID=UPI000AF24C9B|nr:IclR family transcriptional regulator C-terminal domain-containing protein [Streptomyces sp. NBRC 110028]
MDGHDSAFGRRVPVDGVESHAGQPEDLQRRSGGVEEGGVLREAVARATERGYATADEEHHRGLRAIAVPVLRPDGSVFAALSTAAPAFRHSMDDLVAMVPLLQAAASELGVRLPAR